MLFALGATADSSQCRTGVKGCKVCSLFAKLVAVEQPGVLDVTDDDGDGSENGDDHCQEDVGLRTDAIIASGVAEALFEEIEQCEEAETVRKMRDPGHDADAMISHVKHFGLTNTLFGSRAWSHDWEPPVGGVLALGVWSHCGCGRGQVASE
jgi:hypothetical protein